MYEQSSKWNEYYRETNPSRRRRMLDELFMTEPDDSANMLRLKFWEARHLDPHNSGVELDRYAFQFVNMLQIYRTARIFKKSAVRQVRKVLKDLLFDEALALGEAGERALYWELRNAMARYLKTCEGSGFNRSLFGMVASSEAGRNSRVLREIWEMTDGLAERTGLHAELRVWNQAVQDSYCMYDGSGYEKLRSMVK